jgi:hypothetical protein
MFNRDIKIKIPQLKEIRVNAKLRNRDRIQKQRIQYWANKHMAKGYRKFKIGQRVLILRHEKNKGKMLTNWANDICRIVSQKGTSVKVISTSGNIYYRNVSHVKPYFG